MRRSLLCAVVSMMAVWATARTFDGPYEGANLSRIAFPIGGLGAGMYCLEGAGAISHLSVFHHIDVHNEPSCFAAVCILGDRPEANIARVIEGPVPDWKVLGPAESGGGLGGRTYGLPRFRSCSFSARFPFATVTLSDEALPLSVRLTGWSPFTPPDADASSLPAGALEYQFENTSDKPVRAVFSFNTRNFMGKKGSIGSVPGGFALYAQSGETRERAGAFACFTEEKGTHVDHCWFRGGWWDPMTLAWEAVTAGRMIDNPPVPDAAPGASLALPFELKPGETRTIRLNTCWYVPTSELRQGDRTPAQTYEPWYAGRFQSVAEVAAYWRANVDSLRQRSERFRDAFYDSSLPPEALEAVAANLTILKSPTVLRQRDGRLWCWEGCNDASGSCAGSCSHVWNYEQGLCRLFPSLARGTRESFFREGLDAQGRQAFRLNLPISPGGIEFDAADGELGEIMKAHREWRLSGDAAWLRSIWPQVRLAMDYAIRKWDPRETGLLEESHHNTYDIAYFGPDGHCGSFYLGALAAVARMGEAQGENVSRYRALLAKGRARMENELFNGEYFVQNVAKNGLDKNFTPLNPDDQSEAYREVARRINEQGPKYQYGTGCLSDGVLGLWLARECGIDEDLVDPAMVKSHLLSVYKYNLQHNLSTHANPQRPGYAMGSEGGLLLCSWPRGGKPLLPFVYSDEVWSGIEYQVAAHLMLVGEVEKGLDIIRVCRRRYDGVRRNPFDEYECGHWYGRALSSYALVEAFSGVGYDAVEQAVHVRSAVPRDARAFLCTNTGFGTVAVRDGRPTVTVAAGTIPLR